MEEKRKFGRFLTNLAAHYFSEDQRGNWEKCTVINISRKGVGIKLQTAQKMDIGSVIHLAILVPQEPDPVMVKGMWRWIKQKGNSFIGGIELIDELDDAKWESLIPPIT